MKIRQSSAICREFDLTSKPDKKYDKKGPVQKFFILQQNIFENNGFHSHRDGQSGVLYHIEL